MKPKVDTMIKDHVGKWMLVDTKYIFGGSCFSKREQRVPFMCKGQWCIKYKSFIYPIEDAYIYHGLTVLKPSSNSLNQYREMK